MQHFEVCGAPLTVSSTGVLSSGEAVTFLGRPVQHSISCSTLPRKSETQHVIESVASCRKHAYAHLVFAFLAPLGAGCWHWR
jgi:hypothetical protein